MPRIVRSPLAREDLLSLWGWIADEGSPAQADRLIGHVYAALDRLSVFPGLGRVRPEFPGEPRSFVVWPCVIFYASLAEGDGIVVWRILHGARDLGAHVAPPDA